TLQRAVPGTFSASVTIAYTEQELALAGIPPAGAPPSPGFEAETALVVAAFHPGSCTAGGAACAEDRECGASGPCAGARYDPLPTRVDTAAHTVTATGVSSFSTFAVLHPGALAGGPVAPLVLGLGKRRAECRLQWEVISPGSLRPEPHGGPSLWLFVSCRDGDPTCDADRTADGTCVFRVAPCFGIDAARAPRCKRASSTAFAVRARTRRTEGALERANARALLASVAALRGSKVSGGRVVRFLPPLPPGLCAGLTDLSVPVGTSNLPPPMVFRGKVNTLRGSDQDELGLSCLPAS
ncbi:MAG TPA: hypothetical protein VEM57_04525, partial [Candidatus Binatus sp.]|nr:hypothetical protein [Candidatus Binatus sp.]